jgi:hypothetical protein
MGVSISTYSGKWELLGTTELSHGGLQELARNSACRCNKSYRPRGDWPLSVTYLSVSHTVTAVIVFLWFGTNDRPRQTAVGDRPQGFPFRWGPVGFMLAFSSLLEVGLCGPQTFCPARWAKGRGGYKVNWTSSVRFVAGRCLYGPGSDAEMHVVCSVSTSLTKQ